MRSFMRNLLAMQQMKTKLRCLKPHRPYTVDFPIDARERVNKQLSPHENFEKKRKHQQPEEKVCSQPIVDWSASTFVRRSCIDRHSVRGLGDQTGSVATFLATESTGTVIFPGQVSQIAGHVGSCLRFFLKIREREVIFCSQK